MNYNPMMTTAQRKSMESYLSEHASGTLLREKLKDAWKAGFVEKENDCTILEQEIEKLKKEKGGRKNGSEP